MVVEIDPAVLCTIPCRFWASYILFLHARMSARSQLETELQKEVYNKLISTKSILDNDSKTSIKDIRSG